MHLAEAESTSSYERQEAAGFLRLTAWCRASEAARTMQVMTIVSVLYPQTHDSRFDYGYYLQTHIPLVKERWSPLGLERVEMVRGTASMDGGGPAFAMITTLYFTSDDHLQQALTTHGSEVLGDIPNFTDVEPVMQMGEAVV